jgi:myo-inositol 2-dehydrogenase/D-chiro-inositol 1-dehydrogenase
MQPARAASEKPAEPRLLRVAVIGCGPIGILHARAVAASPHARLAALCDLDPARRDAAAREFGVPGFETVEQLLAAERPDVATIATPDHLHVEPALAAIAAGCRVFCEKPLATKLDDAARIVRAASQRSVHLGVDYNRRFAFGCRTAKRLLDEGRIGALRQLRFSVYDRTPPARVARHPLVIFTTLLTHHFDLVRFYGGEVRTISAVAAHEDIEPLVRDVAITCELADGATAAIAAGYRDELTHTVESFELRGTSGVVTVDDVTGPVTLARGPASGGTLAAQEKFRSDETFYDSLTSHVQAFLAAVVEDTPIPVTCHDGLATLRLAAAAMQSIETGQTIELEA